MNAGLLRNRIIIEKKSFAGNGFGGMTETWSTIATVYAKVEHLSGRELTLAQQISPEITYEITIRYRTDLDILKFTEATTFFRLKYKNTYFNILDIKDLHNMHTFLFLKCEVVQSGQ